MEEKKKGVQRFFKLSAGRHKREACLLYTSDAADE